LNFRKADWEAYKAATEKSIPLIPRHGVSIEEAYSRFTRAMSKAAHSVIPWGVRAKYIPCLDEEAKALLEEYKNSGDPDVADHLIESLDASRRARWEHLTSQINFTHSSRKSWALIRRLGATQRPPQSRWRAPVSANAVASHLVQVAKDTKPDKSFERGVRVQTCSNGICLHLTCANVVNPSMTHIDDSCPEFSLDGGLPRLHSADEYACSWLNSVAKEALAK